MDQDPGGKHFKIKTEKNARKTGNIVILFKFSCKFAQAPLFVILLLINILCLFQLQKILLKVRFYQFF